MFADREDCQLQHVFLMLSHGFQRVIARDKKCFPSTFLHILLRGGSLVCIRGSPLGEEGNAWCCSGVPAAAAAAAGACALARSFQGTKIRWLWPSGVNCSSSTEPILSPTSVFDFRLFCCCGMWCVYAGRALDFRNLLVDLLHTRPALHCHSGVR